MWYSYTAYLIAAIVMTLSVLEKVFPEGIFRIARIFKCEISYLWLVARSLCICRASCLIRSLLVVEPCLTRGSTVKGGWAAMRRNGACCCPCESVLLLLFCLIGRNWQELPTSAAADLVGGVLQRLSAIPLYRLLFDAKRSCREDRERERERRTPQ